MPTMKTYLSRLYALYIATQMLKLLEQKMHSHEIDPEEKEVIEALMKYVI